MDEQADAAVARALAGAERICLFAHYHHLGLAAGYMLYYLDALRAAGFSTIVISTADLSEAEADKIRARCTALIVRENVGLDFGGWADALRRYPAIAPDLLLLTNDSVYGPITDLSAFIDRLTAVPADFYGAVESLQITPHVQSWFVLLRPAAYRSAAFRRLMENGPGDDLARFDLITAYEAGLSQGLYDEGLVSHTPFSPAGRGRLSMHWPTNPMQLLWRMLIERYDVPFLKVELIRSNPSGADTRDALKVVEHRNPVLAGLILEDRAERAFGVPKKARLPWRRAMSGLARDIDLPPASVASWINQFDFRFWWAVVLALRKFGALVRRS